MMSKRKQIIAAEVTDERCRYSMEELCERCGVTTELIEQMVEQGILEPEGDRPATWRFSALAIVRSRRVVRLQSDLGVNLPGAALSLDLLDEIGRLRRKLARLQWGSR
jgi:chaperone modulatory protein CbpM